MTDFIKLRWSKVSLRYVFLVSFVLWIIVSIFLTYKYVWTSSEKTTSKGGTFVEGIFDSTSYLPYLRLDEQSKFYQGLLFNSCITHVVTETGAYYTSNLCHLDTSDNQTFIVSFSGDAIWSDGTPLSMDDIAFTYDDVIIKNKWKIKGLSLYSDIKISRDNPNQLKLVFPTASVDNKLFFTNYILPKQALQTVDLEKYRDEFARQPIYSNCANIVAQTSDPNSLIFNLVNCKDSHLNYYQIKNLGTFDNFHDDDNEATSSIVDVYLGESPLRGYTMEKLMTNKIITVFFNTNSDKLRVRTRRALGGLIKRNYYSSGYDQHLIKNTDGLFDVFLSTGTNIKEYMTSPEADGITKKDLTDSKVQSLPSSISINGENQKLVYYIENSQTKNLNITLSNVYDSVSLERKGKSAYDKGFNGKNKKASFVISHAGAMESGINKYTLRGRQKGKKITIATIDLYNIVSQQSSSTGNVNPIVFLYFNDTSYKAIVENIKGIFEQAGISNYFNFRGIDDPEEFQNTILLGEYDIVLNTIDMGQKKDFTRLFATDSTKTNPSQYTNSNLASLLQDYIEKNKPINILNQINEIYAKDMPFVILGKAFVPLNVKDKLVKKLFPNTGTILYDYNWRTTLYTNLELVNNIHIDGKRVWSTSNFTNFIKEGLGLATPIATGTSLQ